MTKRAPKGHPGPKNLEDLVKFLGTGPRRGDQVTVTSRRGSKDGPKFAGTVVGKQRGFVTVEASDRTILTFSRSRNKIRSARD